MMWVDKYTVKRGDTLAAIARNTGWSLRSILLVNPQIINTNVIYVGQIINIPRRERLNPHPVKPGDTLTSIIRSFNVDYAGGNWEFQITLNEVLAYNPHIYNADIIYPGMRVYLPDLG